MDWIEYTGNKWYKHEGEVCPCPMDMEVDVFYLVGSKPSFLPSGWVSHGEHKFGKAGGHEWKCVARWRPNPDKYECKFNGDQLVAYRLRKV